MIMDPKVEKCLKMARNPQVKKFDPKKVYKGQPNPTKI